MSRREASPLYLLLNVALNPNTSVDTLVKLAEDKNSKVHFHTAINPNTPSDLSEHLLTNLGNDKDSMIRLHVAKFTKTPVDVLVQLAQDKHGEVRYVATENLNTLPS